MRRLDARGLLCPLPIRLLERELRRIFEAVEGGGGGSAAEPIEVLADDPAFELDLHAFIATTGHRLSAVERDGGVFRAVVESRPSGEEA